MNIFCHHHNQHRKAFECPWMVFDLRRQFSLIKLTVWKRKEKKKKKKKSA